MVVWLVSKLLCELGIRTQSSNRGVTFASYVQNWCRGNSLACDLSAGHEWRQCGLRCVGLLSANSFVNRKFGSHGTGEEVRPFCAPLWVGPVQCLGSSTYIFAPWPFCVLRNPQWGWRKICHFSSALHLFHHFGWLTQVLGTQPFQMEGESGISAIEQKTKKMPGNADEWGRRSLMLVSYLMEMDECRRRRLLNANKPWVHLCVCFRTSAFNTIWFMNVYIVLS